MMADFIRFPLFSTRPFWVCLLFLGSNPGLLHSIPSLDFPDSLRIEILLEQLLTHPAQQNSTLQSLQKFELHQFSNSNKNKIASYLFNDRIVSKKLVLFAGFLNMEKTLIALSPKHQQDKSFLQHINLALVRAGDSEKTMILHRNLQKISPNDDFVYEVLPLLRYTKQIIIYDWLLNMILSDEKNCHPADAETAGNINCAYRIIEALAPNIIDFPIEIDKWGDLKTDNYPKALAVARDWIRENQGDYKINNQTY